MTNIVFDTVHPTVGLLVNAPAIFARPDFMEWLNTPGRQVLTYHAKGDRPHEYSDVVVLVDTGYDGDSSDMPEDIWKAICDLAYAEYGTCLRLARDATVHVRLTNLQV